MKRHVRLQAAYRSQESQKNLIGSNPGFESDLSGWSYIFGALNPAEQIVNTPVKSGIKALKFGTNVQNYIYKNIAVVAGGRYRFGCWGLNTVSPNYAYIYATGAATPAVTKFLSFFIDYIENSIYFTTTGTLLECGVGIGNSANSQFVYLDDFFLYRLS